MKLIELFEQQHWTAMDVVRDILGPDNVVDDLVTPEEEFKEHHFIVTHSWSNRMPNMFADMDTDTGCICLSDRYGTSPKAIAVAAHEAYHAWLHQNKKQYDDEKHVNILATKWLQQHLSGMQLHAALNTILHSKIHYGHNN